MQQLSKILIFVWIMFVLPGSGLGTAQPANQSDQCQVIHNLAAQGSKGSVPVIPDEYLEISRWSSSLPCLIDVLRRLARNIDRETAQFSENDRSRYLSATGAMRKVIAMLRAADKSGNTSTNIIEFIQVFRDAHDTDVATVLSFGARSIDEIMRSDALLILGNVIDNKTVCASIDHLYDPKISANGRANLLAIVSVVAPWAYAENFDNICRVSNFIGSKLTNEPSMQQTKAIVENVQKRLNSQTAATNQGVYLPVAERACYRYPVEWANKGPTKYLIYEERRPSPSLENCPARF